MRKVMRRPLGPLVVALAVLVAAGAAIAANTPTVKQEILTSGIQPSIKFCGNKPITLAVEDGFGINAWSQESYAAVKSTAAQCKNVKVIAAAGGGVLSTMIAATNAVLGMPAVLWIAKLARPGGLMPVPWPLVIW